MVMEKLKSFISWKDLPELEALCDLIEEESADETETRAKFEEAAVYCGSDIMPSQQCWEELSSKNTLNLR